ncbi:hypothetical protein SLA2020_281760 [Shorea laevis]
MDETNQHKTLTHEACSHNLGLGGVGDWARSVKPTPDSLAMWPMQVKPKSTPPPTFATRFGWSVWDPAEPIGSVPYTEPCRTPRFGSVYRTLPNPLGSAPVKRCSADPEGSAPTYRS